MLDAITAQQSTFSREDVDAYLFDRISDPDAVERIADEVVKNESVRALEIDTKYGLLTTVEMQRIESRLAVNARELTNAKDERYDEAAMRRAAAKMESDRGFRLTDEQRDVLGHLDKRLVVASGMPGVGKTTVMQAVREYADATGRRVVGLTLSSAAAERLELEAGFASINTARAAIAEGRGDEVVPQNGIVVCDESGMTDSRSMDAILSLAKERNCQVIAIGQAEQLQPVSAGASFRILKRESQAAGTYSELRDIRRQSDRAHRDAILAMGDGIADRDEDKIAEGIAKMNHRGILIACKDRDETIDRAARSWRAGNEAKVTTLVIASDKDTVRHINEQIQRERHERGQLGKAREYVADGGRTTLYERDRIIFRENSQGPRGIGVLNGYTGTVLEVKPNRIVVELDENRGRVEFSPSRYQAFALGYASTTHAAQGASVDRCVAVLDRSATAELAFVALSRAKHATEALYASTNFSSVEQIGEHLGRRISAKTTLQTYDEALARHGGPETTRIRNIEAQREALGAPLRRLYEAEMAERERVRMERIEAVQTAYRERAKAFPEDASLGDRLVATKALSQERRRAIAAVMKAHAPQTYASWFDAREQAMEQRVHAERERQAERDLTRRRDRSIDPDRSRQSRRGGPEIEHERDDYEIER